MRNNNSSNLSPNKLNNSDENEEISLQPLFRNIIREKVLVLSITSFTTIAALVYSYTTPTIYKGTFQIVVEKRKNMESTTQQFSIVRSQTRDNLTEIHILKSNLLLKPAYEKVKEISTSNNRKYELNEFNDWKEKLNISFKEYSKILDVELKDKNTELILDSLNAVSNQYESFSRRDRKKYLVKTINYLEKQKIRLTDESRKASIEAANFSIENGLGDFDGFVDIGTQKFDPATLKISSQENISSAQKFDLKSRIELPDPTANQRFKSQFILLEKYEREFMDLSSQLKPESEILKNLKIKIENLRESLKRPSEVILKFKELQKTSTRSQKILDDIIYNLELAKLEKIKQQDPWELITPPEIEGIIWPNKKLIGSLSFIGSAIFGILIAIFKEKKKGTIYEISEIKDNVNLEYLGNLYLDDLDLNLNLILNYLNIFKTDIKESTLSFVFFAKNKSLNKKTINFLPPKIFKNYNNFLTTESLFKYENIILIIESEDLNYSDLQLLNDLISTNRKNLRGWFFIDKN